MELTEHFIEFAEPIDKTKKYADKHGLSLEVRPSGKKIFVFRFQWCARPQTLTLGRWPALSLGKARKIAEKYRQCLDQGLDPRKEADKAKRTRTTFINEYLNYLLNDAPDIPMNMLYNEVLNKFIESLKTYSLMHEVDKDLQAAINESNT